MRYVAWLLPWGVLGAAIGLIGTSLGIGWEYLFAFLVRIWAGLVVLQWSTRDEP